MKPRKARLKRNLMVQHREERYLHAINKVIDGDAEPEYASTRFKKLKEVRG